MHPLQTLELPELVDMLAKYTARYTEMMTKGGTQEEYGSCKKTIEDLQKEIKFRNFECDHVSGIADRSFAWGSMR